ncbi:hypothetical protein SAMN04487928_11950 [Butyrivibrio proteoclasticus]|uniref:Uncharacterized protein n=1 Tax=Butyrivibrio proteoclasticus TaxID=43305 RepID=A0A1I5VW45_9FIRM|nr:hypothetical protein [Butyrivibrio proteoclasticus]SFQ11670.1 hypothetical protein SAMN04487928_11950 [Butyrivibrio proteoclasticus]
MIRAIWICTIIIPEFADVFNVKKGIIEGWLSGMFTILKSSDDMVIVPGQIKELSGDSVDWTSNGHW